jgi:Rrf2 family protein
MTAAYATRALVCLADHPDRLSGAEELSSRTGVSRPYLVKVLHALARKGFVVTRRGHRGGYRLGRAPGAITLFEIVAAVDGTEAFERCLLGLGRCSAKRGCPLHSQWSGQRERVKKRFQTLTLRELVGFKNFDFERDYGFGRNGNPRFGMNGSDCVGGDA